MMDFSCHDISADFHFGIVFDSAAFIMISKSDSVFSWISFRVIFRGVSRI